MRGRADISPEEIRFMLNREGLSFADVDRAHNLRPGTSRKAARYPVSAGERAIAATLKRAPEEIWPSRFTRTGARLKPQPPANYTKWPRMGGVKNSKAA